MSGSGVVVPGSYARAIERLWAELCGRAVIISKRDWKLIEEWYERGIPLQIIEEAVGAALERRRKGKEAPPPRGLAYIAPAVDEGWLTVLEGRSAGDRPAGGREAASGPDPIAGWRERLQAETEDSGVGGLLAELIDAYERGQEPAALDDRLDEMLPKVVPGELLRAVVSELEVELAQHKERMEPSVYEATMRRATAMRLRQRLRLGKLSRA